MSNNVLEYLLQVMGVKQCIGVPTPGNGCQTGEGERRKKDEPSEHFVGDLAPGVRVVRPEGQWVHTRSTPLFL